MRLAGLPFLAAGMALAIWFLLAMRAAGTPADPREASTAVVQTGPVRYTRNPAYVALLSPIWACRYSPALAGH